MLLRKRSINHFHTICGFDFAQWDLASLCLTREGRCCWMIHMVVRVQDVSERVGEVIIGMCVPQRVQM